MAFFVLFVFIVLVPLPVEAAELQQECYATCMEQQGEYAHICRTICTPHSTEAPRKNALEQRACYQDCTRGGRGALWCMMRCRRFAHTRAVEEQLPPLEDLVIE